MACLVGWIPALDEQGRYPTNTPFNKGARHDPDHDPRTDLGTETDNTPIPNRIKPINLKKANDVTKVTGFLAAETQERILDLLAQNPDCISSSECAMLFEALESADYRLVRASIERVNHLIGRHNDLVGDALLAEAQRQRQAQIDADLALTRTRLRALKPGDPGRPAWMDQR